MANLRQAPSPTNMVHHIGIAVQNLEAALGVYRDFFGLVPGPTIDLEDRGIRGCFVPVGETNLELLEGTHPDSNIATFIRNRGEGLHHLCFEVGDVGQCLTDLNAKGVTLVDEVPRPGLAGGLIGFLDPGVSNGVLIEIAQHG